jgi:hypothetical protein
VPIDNPKTTVSGPRFWGANPKNHGAWGANRHTPETTVSGVPNDTPKPFDTPKTTVSEVPIDTPKTTVSGVPIVTPQTFTKPTPDFFFKKGSNENSIFSKRTHHVFKKIDQFCRKKMTLV